MKVSYLFHLFNAVNLFARASKAQAFPDIIFENNSTYALVFKKEYAQAAFTEYDVPHQVLQPTDKQWVAFSQNDGSDTLSYDVCDTSGKEAIIYVKGNPECVSYSGGTLNVTATINNITAHGNNFIQLLNILKVKENQTDSDACLDVYDISFMLADSDPNYAPSQSSNSKVLSETQILLAVTLFSLAAMFLVLCLCKNQQLWQKRRDESTAENQKNGILLFSPRAFLASPEESLLPSHHVKKMVA